MSASTQARTRQGLHGIAELLMAGPQFRTSGTIKLRVTGDGFQTWTEPSIALRGTEIVSGTLHLAVNGHSVAELARACGVQPGAPAGLYPDGSGLGVAEPLVIDEAAAATIQRGLTLGDAALRALDPAAEPVLWPEHFDVGIVVADVGYGVSAGDGHHDEPYAYLSVTDPPADEFFNAPFGASRPLRTLADADEMLAFFRTGQALTAR